MKNNWLIPLIEGLEQEEFYGKLVLNFCQGSVPKVRQEKDILKPKTQQIQKCCECARVTTTDCTGVKCVMNNYELFIKLEPNEGKREGMKDVIRVSLEWNDQVYSIGIALRSNDAESIESLRRELVGVVDRTFRKRIFKKEYDDLDEKIFKYKKLLFES